MKRQRLKVVPSNNVFELGAGAPLIELDDCKDSGIQFGCRAGACGSCVIRVVSGGEGLSRRSEDESFALNIIGFAEPEYRLACQTNMQENFDSEVVIEGMSSC